MIGNQRVEVNLEKANLSVIRITAMRSGKERRSLRLRAIEKGVEVSIEVPDSADLLLALGEARAWENAER